MNLLKNFWARLKNIKRETYIKNSFLLPILFVVFISISHTVTWYDIGNPLAWAMYLSVAIEVFALASISAASVNVSKGSIWFLFSLVTAIQMIGNIFFSFNDIDVNGQLFTSWIDMIQPLFSDWDLTDHRRFLAAIQGGTLPIMSLTALHFYLKFNDNKPLTIAEPIEDVEAEPIEDVEEEVVEEPIEEVVEEPIEEVVEEEVPVEPEPVTPKKEIIDPTDESNPFWRGLTKPKPESPADDDDFSKYNPQE